MSTPQSRDGVWDAGLQPERTALAWRRTALTLGVVSLLLARLLAERSVTIALVVGSLGVVAAILTFLAVERRYRSHHLRLRLATQDPVQLAGGRLPMIVSVVTLLLAGGAAVAVILVALGTNY